MWGRMDMSVKIIIKYIKKMERRAFRFLDTIGIDRAKDDFRYYPDNNEMVYLMDAKYAVIIAEADYKVDNPYKKMWEELKEVISVSRLEENVCELEEKYLNKND